MSDKIKRPAMEVQKQREENSRIRKKLDKSDRQMICKCTHIDKKGDFGIVPKGKNENGELIFMCKLCGKEVNINNIPMDVLNNALKVIDQGCDTIKMLLNVENEKDQKIYRRIAKIQYRLGEFSGLYEAAKTRNKSKGNKKNRSGSNDQTGWNRPVSR